MARNFDDPFTTYRTDLDSPAQYAFEITPTDDTVLTTSIRGLYVGGGPDGGGNVYCRLIGNSNADFPSQANVLFQQVMAGTIIPARIEAVWSSNVLNTTQNTTSTGLIGLY